MNIALLCVLIIITGETDGFHVGNIGAPLKEETGERISLRKLRSFESDEPKDVKTATWNQILADALVNRIKIFSFHKVTETEHATDVGTSSNFLTNVISQMMSLYKTFIYDKIYERPNSTRPKSYEETELNIQKKKIQNNAREEVNVETETIFRDPKDEIEVIEPNYHGKLCDECVENKQNDVPKNGTGDAVASTETVRTTVACRSGLVASEGGGCTEPKSKFILSIPYQCPTGYRRDWLGYCRPQL